MTCNMKGYTLWFTGLPCSGKTAIADIVAQKLKGMGKNVERLDGDVVRKGLTNDLGFSKEDRDKNISRVTFVAKLLSRNNVATLCTFVSPYIERRNKTRQEIDEHSKFYEVFVDCPVEVCAKRDVKGMYAKAFAGEIKEFTGVDDPYENPPNPDLIIKSAEENLDESVNKVMDFLKEQDLL